MDLLLTNRDGFVDTFIGNLARVADNGVLVLEGSNITCRAKNADSTIAIFSSYNNTAVLTDTPTKINIPDFKKLTRLLGLVGSTVKLSLTENSLVYKSDSIRFKFHLYEDGVIVAPSLSLEKVSKIPFDTEFMLTSNNLSELFKGSVLLAEASKVYFNITNEVVFGDITDNAVANTDSFSTKLSDKVTTTSPSPLNKSIPLNIEILKLLVAYKSQTIAVRFASSLNVFMFETTVDGVNTKYIISGLSS